MNQTPTPPAPPSSNRRALGCLVEIVETVVLTLVLFWVIQSFVAQPFQVRQFSMQDTIEDGQFVLVDRLTPRFNPYHRGDIIVFTPPENAETGSKEPFIKRVIGVAGDTVSIRDGKVYVNGIELDEPYVFKQDGVAQPTTPDGGISSWPVPDGMLFVMGDHRARSSDSRVFGPIAIDSVIGRAWLRYWPLTDFSVLPTDSHPELGGASPGPGASATPSARPSSTTKPKPTKTPKP
jgi:signal peptidase I